MTLCGCKEELATDYGIRQTTSAGLSVNGTAVLAKMFEQAGHQVLTRRALTPTLAGGAETIVWFPDSFSPPPTKVIKWFNDWLSRDPNRTLIYVGRDFDAAAHYWDAVIPGAPPNMDKELKQCRTDAIQKWSIRRGTGSSADCAWFKINHSAKHRAVDVLSGPWAAGVDPKKAQIEIEGRIEPKQPKGPNRPQQVDTLLASRGDLLAWQFQPARGGGRIMVVANGSFLLNYPLINHEHRKLAARLVGEVAPNSPVTFLESGANGLPIRDDEPPTQIPSGLTMFTVWPINVLLLHLAALGVVLCVCWWPIFGRPRSLPREAVSDFGKHIDALGEMLELTRDHAYATIRVLQYQQAQRGEAVPPSALRGATSALPTGQTTGAPPDAANTGRRGSPPAREQL